MYYFILRENNCGQITKNNKIDMQTFGWGSTVGSEIHLMEKLNLKERTIKIVHIWNTSKQIISEKLFQN